MFWQLVGLCSHLCGQAQPPHLQEGAIRSSCPEKFDCGVIPYIYLHFFIDTWKYICCYNIEIGFKSSVFVGIKRKQLSNEIKLWTQDKW